MQKFMRSVNIDICDYTKKPLCNLYSSGNEISGQAVDVFVHTERNGSKELRFKIPEKVLEENGYEENYRLKFLISDYSIKFQHKKENGTVETDWYLISESKITHDKKRKNYEVVAKHISSLLRTKNLDLEFSDQEGNNFGAIGEIAATILEGTGWHLGDVRHFYEEDKYAHGEKIEKKRTFTAAAKTGAFKMMSDLCELFDAKPIYHGEGTYIEDGIEKVGRTVDIIPMNPFSDKLEEGNIPEEVLLGENVLALYYDKNISNITRTMNTENIVTKLSAYGSFGDRTGMCSLQNAEHAVITFGSLPAGSYRFLYLNGYYFFVTDKHTNGLKWSYLDFTSRSYVYDGVNLYKVTRDAPASYTDISGTISTEKNYLPYIMDFTYYQKIGLLTDDMLRVLAEHQTNLPQQHIAATEASIALSDVKNELSKTASSGEGYLMLDILTTNVVEGNVVLTIKKTPDSDGVIFRSDYDEAKRNYFSWRVATGINEKGMAVAGRGAVVYIVNEGNPTTWVKAYIRSLGDGVYTYYRDSLDNTYTLHDKNYYPDYDSFPARGGPNLIYIAMDTNKMYAWFNDKYVEIKYSDYFYGLNEFEEPTTITLWTSNNNWTRNSKVYLFSADSIAGVFGPVEDSLINNKYSIENTTKVATEKHPIYFVNESDPAPSPPTKGYAWYYRSYSNRFTFGDLYFCWCENGDTNWHRVNVSRENVNPEKLVPSGYNYYYSIPRRMLYHAGTNWIPVNKTVDNDTLTSHFATVINGCQKQERLTKGVKEEYYYSGSSQYPIGNYAFANEFDSYYLFTTTQVINPSSYRIRYKNDKRLVWQDEDENHILKPIESEYSVLDFPVDNELDGVIYSDGNYVNGVFIDDEPVKKISSNISVHDNTEYVFRLPEGSRIVCRDMNAKVLDEFTTSPFTTPNNTTHIRIVAPTLPLPLNYLQVKNYDTCLFYKNKQYTILPCSGAGMRNGIHELMDRFISLCNEAYMVRLPALKQAQEYIKQSINYLMETLGDMYREGFWQEGKYAEGNEPKLYSDALDNLKEISHPETTYDFTFLDLYGSDENVDTDVDVSWPDIEITDAAHLVDKDIDANCWAYIDVINKCYDQPWKTEIQINTRLSMIGQQSFTDVLTRIAEVASEVKAKQAIYDRASALTGSGKLAADRLEGFIQTNKLYLMGGTSNWYTDDKGNIIFEAADNNSAMMLTGRGLCVANTRDIYGDWDWRTAISGLGINADSIYTGYLSAERIEAGSITTDKLSASVGQELEIGSNRALMLYATVNGLRPAGGLRTPTVQASDSYIEIAAKNGTDPAYINIMTGGLMNIYSGSKMNIESGAEMKIKSGADLNIESGGKLAIKSGSTFTVVSTNFNVKQNGDVDITGKINAKSGNIAGLTVDTDNVNRKFMYSGTNSLESNIKGIYLGTDGINVGGGVFVVSADGNTTKFKTTANNIELGNVTLASTFTEMNEATASAQRAADDAQDAADDAQDAADDAKKIAASKSKTFRCTSTQIVNENYEVGDTWTCTDTFKDAAGNDVCYYYQYVCKKVSNPKSATNDWTLTGTGITAGAALAINTASGTIDMIAANNINVVSGATIAIAANKSVTITSGGSVVIGNAGNPFTIGSNKTNAYIYHGPSSIGANVDGVYLGTDGLYIRGTKNSKVSYVKATANGTVEVTGSISGSTISGSTISGNTITGGTISGSTITGGSLNIGNGQCEISSTGKLTAKDADIKGAIAATSGSFGNWVIHGTQIYSKKVNDEDLNARVGLEGYRRNDETTSIWAGSTKEGPTDAPFRVTFNGHLYTDLADIGTLALSKLSTNHIKYDRLNVERTGLFVESVSTSKLTLSDGTEVNFNSPSSISKGWAGTTYTVKNKNTGTELASTTLTGTKLDIDDKGQAQHDGNTYNIIVVADSSTDIKLINGLDATKIVDYGKDQVGMKISGNSIVLDKTSNTTTSYAITLDVGTGPDASGNRTVKAMAGSTQMASGVIPDYRNGHAQGVIDGKAAVVPSATVSYATYSTATTSTVTVKVFKDGTQYSSDTRTINTSSPYNQGSPKAVSIGDHITTTKAYYQATVMRTDDTTVQMSVNCLAPYNDGYKAAADSFSNPSGSTNVTIPTASGGTETISCRLGVISPNVVATLKGVAKESLTISAGITKMQYNTTTHKYDITAYSYAGTTAMGKVDTSTMTTAYDDGYAKAQPSSLVLGSKKEGKTYNITYTPVEGSAVTYECDATTAYDGGFAAAKANYSISGGVLNVSKSLSGSYSFPLSLSGAVQCTYNSTTHKYTAVATLDDNYLTESETGTLAYDNGWNDCVDGATMLERYTRDTDGSGGESRVHFILVKGKYENVGTGWWKTTRVYDSYKLPDKK